ncbi:MAG: HopJ type III effector protein [Gammaproteobacteria bacterium]|nr:HopJ type III effector protein [Gammaproteobacteria bacterium]MDH5650297.1 HopJ type III effector protein [Gammaproteobacteria bacterium]
MNLNNFLTALRVQPDSITFDDTMAVIDANYHFTPAAFSNGDQFNDAGQNNGSCKLFAFARLHHLTEQQTLACFGDYYRKDVLENPDGDDHANIRNFMQTGWSGIRFDSQPLNPKH